MVIVNPYLNKKKKPSVSAASTTTNNNGSSSNRTPTVTLPAGRVAVAVADAIGGTTTTNNANNGTNAAEAQRRHVTPAKPTSSMVSQHHRPPLTSGTSALTPIGGKIASSQLSTTTSGRSGGGGSVRSGGTGLPIMVTPGKKLMPTATIPTATATKGTVSAQQKQVLQHQPLPTKAQAQARPMTTLPLSQSAATAPPRKSLPPFGGLPPFRGPLKGGGAGGGGSVKQQLKQEIAMLKKQKQLKKLQKEAEERRKVVLAEKEQQEHQRRAFLAAREQERKQKQEERDLAAQSRLQEQQKKQQERLAEQERRREEKRIMEEMQERREEEIWQLQRQQAEEKYQRELHAWKYQHQQWLQQQQQQQMQQQQQAMVYPESAMSAYSLSSPMIPYSHAGLHPNQYGAYMNYPMPQMPHPPLQQYPHNGLLPYGKGIIAGYPMATWMLPPPPRPPILVRGAQRKPSTQSKSSTAAAPQISRLCDPLEHPSPFAQQGRTLVSLTLVREPESSFGVNLILHKVSALVDPDWIDAHEGSLRKATIPEKNETAGTGSRAEQQDSSDSTGEKMKVDQKMDDGAIQKVTHCDVMKNELEAGAIPKSVCKPAFSSLKDLLDPVEKPIEMSKEEHIQLKNAPDIQNLSSAAQIEASSGNIDAAKHENKSPEETSHQNGDQGKPVLDSATFIPVKETTTSALSSTIEAHKKRRRRRFNFAVMMVSDANKQNARRPDIKSDEKIQPGDIVISIGDQKTVGMFFSDACSLFGSKAQKNDDTLMETQVLVARKNPPAPGPARLVAPSVPSTMLSSSQSSSDHRLMENNSMDFSPTEVALLATTVMATLHHSNRILGRDANDSVWQDASIIFRSAVFRSDSVIPFRSVNILKEKWQVQVRNMEFAVANRAREAWLEKCKEDYGPIESPFSSEVERAALRQAARGGPRPAKGCRCGREDHEFLFDHECFLFRDLRKRLSAAELEEFIPKTTKKKGSKENTEKTLNAVSSANMNRRLKLKEVTGKEDAEQRFVSKMEEIQVKELKRAIFAPNLTTMALSAINELQREFLSTQNPEDSDDEDEETDDEDNDDDDVPLVSLGKRESTDKDNECSRKQQKVAKGHDPKINLEFLLRLLEFVGKTWGHCYRESSKEEYAWRWEVFHGSYSTDQRWEANSPTPRMTDSLPFERVHHGISATKTIRREISALPGCIREFENSILSPTPVEQNSSAPVIETQVNGSTRMEVESADTAKTFPANTLKSSNKLDLSGESLDQLCSLTHFLSPASSGLYDEILALLKMNVLRVRNGIPVLRDDWYENVDIIVLDDMSEYWSTEVDPDGKYCVNVEIRDTLEEKWIKYDYGWALAEYPKELIFDYSVLDEWRETFEGRLEEQGKRSEGIGRFGL